MLITGPTHAPCEVFDANGLEWKDLVWVDTETGEGEQLVRGFGTYVVEGNDLKRQKVKLAAPVIYKPLPKEHQTPTLAETEADKRNA